MLVIQWWGIAGGAVLAGLGALLEPRGSRAVGLRVAAGGLISAVSALSLFGITDAMLALRDQMGIVDLLPLDDSRRVAFNQLHRASSAAHLVILAVNAVLVALPVTTIRPTRKAAPSSETARVDDDVVAVD
jgi:hypothetical protein